jgi:hypothetical protein
MNLVSSHWQPVPPVVAWLRTRRYGLSFVTIEQTLRPIERRHPVSLRRLRSGLL